MAETIELLIELDKYLAAGIHIGTQIKTKSMEPFVYRIRSDGLYVLDVRKTDERIRTAAKFLSRYDPSKIVTISVRQYGQRPVEQFSNIIHGKSIPGRFVPGQLTNPSIENYLEPDVVVLTDPRADAQALRETVNIKIPVIALCDTDNTTKNVDLVIPTNNKGRRALSLIFWLFARQILRERGDIGPTDELSVTIDDFEASIRRSAKPVEEF